MNDIFESALNMIYPPRCIRCDDVLKVGKRGLCENCKGKLKYINEPVCMSCGRPVLDTEEFCTNCRDKDFSFDQGKCVLVYDTYMQNSIAKFKYHGRQEYAETYAKIVVDRVGDWIKIISPDALLPVPIHSERYKTRGYNQAELLCDEISKITGIPVESSLLVRTKKTSRQKELDYAERLKNMKSAFGVSSETTPIKTALIVDDILTTGSTIEACAYCLRQLDISRIYFLCLCTTLR